MRSFVFSIIFALFATVGILVSANSHAGLFDDDDLPPEQQAVLRRLPLTFDPAVPQEEKNLVLSDLAWFSKVQLPTFSESDPFNQIFNGTTPDDVFDFIQQRIRIIIPDHFSIDAHFRFTKSTSSLETVATNVGFVLWFEALYNPDLYAYYRIRNAAIPVHSSRVGVMQLNKGFKTTSDGQYYFDRITRVTSFVHEARHSDCRNGAHRSDINAFNMDGDPTHHECGNLHVKCPPWHQYAGEYACDDIAWGAYSVEAVFLGGLAQCQNCTAKERHDASISEADSLSRVLYKEPMLKGLMGPPDMTSSTAVYED